MITKAPVPRNMREVNQTVFSNLIINDYTNFQLAHAETDKEKSFLVLIRFEDGIEQGENHKITKMGFVLVNAFNNIPDGKYYIINSVEKTTSTDEVYQQGMFNLTVKIELADDPSEAVYYLEEETVLKSKGELIDIHIKDKHEEDEIISWRPKNTGGHLCKSKTSKGG